MPSHQQSTLVKAHVLAGRRWQALQVHPAVAGRCHRLAIVMEAHVASLGCRKALEDHTRWLADVHLAGHGIHQHRLIRLHCNKRAHTGMLI